MKSIQTNYISRKIIMYFDINKSRSHGKTEMRCNRVAKLYVVNLVDSVTPSISPNLTANATTSNTTVTLTCTVIYGGPNPRLPSSQDQSDKIPQLSMALGTMDLTNASTLQFTQGDAGMSRSVLTRVRIA
jgi:hypothetical protein